jgi:transposase
MSERYKDVLLLFFDEARFGRISEISHCWCFDGHRPVIPSLKIRKYLNVYGAVSPTRGDSSFIIAPSCNTAWTSAFFDVVGKQFHDYYIVMAGDNASWHKSKGLVLPENMELQFIPPCTPEMNPAEQLWDEMREKHFKNKSFETLDNVETKLCEVLKGLPKNLIKSLCGRDWVNS